MTATEASRNFSDALNRAAAGEEIEITRGGVPVAVLGPARARLLPPARLIELLGTAPPVDDQFADDLRAIRRSVGPPESPWRS